MDYLSPEDELFLFETFTKLTKQEHKSSCRFFDDEDDIPLSEFFLFGEKGYEECQSPPESIYSPDSSDGLQFFPMSFSDDSSPSPCHSPTSILPPVLIENVFSSCTTPPPPLTPVSSTIPYPPPSPISQAPICQTQISYVPPPPTGAEMASVQFIDVKDLYEKTQVRRGGVSEQRLVDCRVHMFANFTTPIRDIEVYVHRHPETHQFEDRMKLPVTTEKTLPNVQYFSINLDAVYRTSLGNKFYQLSTTDRFKKNRFSISVILTFADDSKLLRKSEPFLIRSRKQSPNPRKPRSYST